MKYALVFLTTLSCTGCAATFDLAYLLAGSDARSQDIGIGYETEPVESERRIRFDPSAGLICEDVERPTVRRTEFRTDSEHLNGWLELMWGGTVVDGLILTTAVLVHEFGCDEQCTPREHVYPWFAPVAASFLWGIYRSLTIHPEILESGYTTRRNVPGDSYVYPCPPGTLVEVAVEQEARVPFRIAEVGRLEEAGRTVLINLLRIDGEIRAWIGGVEVEVVTGRLESLRAEARARTRREREEARRSAPPPPAPPAVIPMPPPRPARPDGVHIEIEACLDGINCIHR